MLTLGALVLDYIFVAPNVHGTFFFGKVTIILYWFLEVFFLSALRFAYRYFRYTRVAPSCADRGCVADAADRPRGGRGNSACAGSKAARSSGCGRSACCRRRSPIAAS